MWTKIRLLGLVLILQVVIGCEEANAPDTTNPANLEVEVNIAEDGSGQVEFLATADNAIEYQLFPGDDLSGVAVTSVTGEFTHTYTASSSYMVEIRAYGSSGKFLKQEIQIAVIVAGDDPDAGYTTPPVYDGMSLIWADEFNGTSLDEADWTYEIGTGSNGWGNNELQYYRRENTTVQDGYLTIEARRENFGGKSYTSSRLITMDKFSFKYGRIDIRAKLPKGKGLWPALWMLGSNFKSVGWPSCGEIDIMELVGGSTTDNTVHSTVHWDNNGTKADYGLSYTLSEGIFNDKFHVFSMIWDQTQIRCFVDDKSFFTINTTPAALSEFQQNFFFIFNVAVGGNWPGSPDATTVFPQKMVVDYVRVFQPI